MEKLNLLKTNGQVLDADEWNQAINKVNEVIDFVEDLSPATIQGISISDKGNLQLESSKHINLEPAYNADGGTENDEVYGDIQMKPGDDITLESSHRPLNKRNEITVKTSNGLSKSNKATVKLLLKAADITLSSEGKKVLEGENDSPNVMNINVTTGEGKGYLKVRAQAIDLRCEDNGGIALQPKGSDSRGNENKIKFEHNGGDGLEFGTFNTQHTSVFTSDYRFNKDGIIYAVTREEPTTISYKEDGITPKKIDYPTQSDDFKDVISEDPYTNCTWGDLIKFVSWAKANKSGKDWESLWANE